MSVNTDPAIVDKAKRLFQFLAESQRLRSSPVKTTDSYSGAEQLIRWIDRVPEHPAVELAFRDGASEPEDGFVVSCDRVPARTPPELPAVLEGWVRGNLEDCEAEVSLLSTISRPGADRPEDRESVPGVDEAFGQWHSRWRSWAEVECRDRPVRVFYEDLFRAHTTIEGRSEEFELLLGVGLLSWQHDTGPVRRHVSTAQLTTSIDDRTGRIDVTVEDSAIGLRAELDMIDPSAFKAASVRQEFVSASHDHGAHPLDEESYGPLAASLVNRLDSRGEYSSSFESTKPVEYPVIAFAPAVILRKRTRAGLLELLNTIASQIDEARAVPASVVPLVDPGQPPPRVASNRPGALLPIDGDIFSPLPLNEIQRQIIEKVDSNAQVVVQGPPGTGKTHTAAALLSHLLAQGQRVLVTAQTDRALHEVRNKLPEQIRPLAVSVIGAARSDMADLKLAVDTISRRSADHDPQAGHAVVEAALLQAEDLRQQRLSLGRAMLTAREQETREHVHRRYRGTLAAIAQAYAADASRFDWSTDLVPDRADGVCPITDEEASTWLRHLRDAELHEDEIAARRRLPLIVDLATPESFVDLVQTRTAASAALTGHGTIRSHHAAAAIGALDPERRHRLQSTVHRVLHRFEVLDQLRASWKDDALRDVRAGVPQVWHQRRENLQALIGQARAHAEVVGGGTEVTVSGDFGPLLNLADHLRGIVEKSPLKVNADGTPKLGLFTSRAVKQAIPLFQQAKVDGVPPVTVRHLDQLQAFIKGSMALNAADKLWPVSLSIPEEDTLTERIAWHQSQLDQLGDVLDLGRSLGEINAELTRDGIPQPDWRDVEAVSAYSRVVDAEDAADALTGAEGPLAALRNRVESVAHWPDSAAAATRLRQAIDDEDHVAYAEAFAEVERLTTVRQKASERDSIEGRIAAVAPSLVKAVKGTANDNHSWSGRMAGLAAAWDWTTTATWILEQEAVDINALQAKIAVLESRLRERAEIIAAARAWNHAIGPERLSLSERPNLIQYSQLVTKLGKGTGKYAARQRGEIRIAMGRCRPLVPVWIMPLYRLAEQLDVQPNMFDVVLVDEASQAGVEAMFLQYLAKRIIVIGDDKQVSPSAVGVDKDKICQLADQYIRDDLYKASWQDPQRSLFDEANMRFGGRLTLTEHRRCVPEIIGFSNRIAYAPEGIRLIPVRQFGSDRLPPIKTVFCETGYQRGPSGNVVNDAEAEAVVRTVLKCLEDPTYDGKTFGVISLVGSRQASLIESMLLQRVPAQEWAARQLRCGDSAAFQGSERDVMFLSMVSGKEDGGMVPGNLTGDRFVQRFNVAVSRAKDQFWLFHSVTMEQFKGKEDMRFQLLEYCQNVIASKSSVDGVVPEPVSETDRVTPFDSLFEQRVHNLIVDRGFVVQPQVDASGYRIDLVVVGSRGRLAVECDGDAWHGPDAYQADLARQRELERCGWRFFRVRESAFYVDRVVALQGLWAMLEELEIRPVGSELEAPPDFPPAVTREDAPALTEADPAVEQFETVLDGIAATPEPSGGLMARMPVAAPTPHYPSAGALAPYEAFADETIPVERASLANLVDGLLRIIEVEGPVLGERLQQAYVASSGGQRVGKNIGTSLNRALSRGIANGTFREENPLRVSGHTLRTFYLAGQDEKAPRVLGPRTLSQVPPRELANILRVAAKNDFRRPDEGIYRAALAILGKKSLTQTALDSLDGARRLIDESTARGSGVIDVSDLVGLDEPADPRQAISPQIVEPMVLSVLNAPSDPAVERQRLAAQFHREMVLLHRRAAREAGYNATGFIRMISEHGGLETARRLIGAATTSDGFTHLWERGRLDLTAEALVLRPEFAPLFAPQEIERARQRIDDFEYRESGRG